MGLNLNQLKSIEDNLNQIKVIKLLEGWDIAYKVKFLIVVNLVASRTIVVPCDIQVDTLPPCGPSG